MGSERRVGRGDEEKAAHERGVTARARARERERERERDGEREREREI